MIKTPARQRSTAAEWLAGPFADRIAAIQDFALQKAGPRDTALAIETLQVSAHLSASCSYAGTLLRQADTCCLQVWCLLPGHRPCIVPRLASSQPEAIGTYQVMSHV